MSDIDNQATATVSRCWSCEGSGIRPSWLYLIPFWRPMQCRRCRGTGVFTIERLDVQTQDQVKYILARLEKAEIDAQFHAVSSRLGSPRGMHYAGQGIAFHRARKLVREVMLGEREKQ